MDGNIESDPLGILHRNPCRAHMTITDFQGGKCAKIFSGFVVGSAHLHLPNRVAKHLRHKFYSFWNLLPKHRSNSITNTIGLYANNAHQTQHRADEEENRKSVQADCILPYGSARVDHQSLRQKASKKVAVGIVRRNETRRTHRAPMTSGEHEFLQSFAEAFANALAVRPCRNRTDFCLPGSYQAGGRPTRAPWLGNRKSPGAKVSV